MGIFWTKVKQKPPRLQIFSGPEAGGLSHDTHRAQESK